MIKLFKTNYKKTDSLIDPLLLDTPLGKINLEVVFDEVKLSNFPPNIRGEISQSIPIYIWEFPEFHIELIKAEIEPKLPPGMRVESCIIYLWRFKNISTKKIRTKFNCYLSSKENSIVGEMETGEGLISQYWQCHNVKLSIGTEDEEFLFNRAKNQRGLPLRLAESNLIDADLIECNDDSIQISLPPFLENEEGQIQFVISWASGKKQDLISTWFAVDMSPEEILKLINA